MNINKNNFNLKGATVLHPGTQYQTQDFFITYSSLLRSSLLCVRNYSSYYFRREAFTACLLFLLLARALIGWTTLLSCVRHLWIILLMRLMIVGLIQAVGAKRLLVIILVIVLLKLKNIMKALFYKYWYRLEDLILEAAGWRYLQRCVASSWTSISLRALC